MSDPHHRRCRPFVTLPRHRRSDAVIRLKNRLRRDASVYGGRFASWHALPDPDSYCQWFDFHFPRSDRFTFWNAAMITARQDFLDAVCRQASASGWREAQIICDAPPVVHESFRVDRRYESGVGLHIVSDIERIDRVGIEAAIDRFFAVGETDWQSPLPVPRDRLPIAGNSVVQMLTVR